MRITDPFHDPSEDSWKYKKQKHKTATICPFCNGRLTGIFIHHNGRLKLMKDRLGCFKCNKVFVFRLIEADEPEDNDRYLDK